MAKRPPLNAIKRIKPITQATEPPPTPDDMATSEQDRTKVISVGLKESEIKRLSEISIENDVTRHNLMLWALRRFLHDYDAGTIVLAKELKTIKRL